MPDVYCDPSATGANDGSGWADAYDDLQTALTAAGHGGKVFFKGREQIPGGTYSFPPTKLATELIGCLTGTTNEPPQSSDLAPKGHVDAPVIEGTANGSAINFTGETYIQGVIIQSGGAINLNMSGQQIGHFKDCLFLINAITASSKYFNVGNSRNNGVVFENVDVDFQAGAQPNQMFITQGAHFKWFGGSAKNNPNVSLVRFSSQSGTVQMHGVDLSSVQSGLAIFTDSKAVLILNRCKLNASVPRVVDFSDGRGEATLHHCDFEDTNDIFEDHRLAGSLTTSKTKYRDNALTDPDSTLISLILSGSADANDHAFYHCKIADLWLQASTPKTLEVHFVQDDAASPPAALRDDEIWMEVIYKGSGTPQATIQNDRRADILSTPADQDASVEAWTGLDAFSTKQKCSITTAGGDDGPAEVYICAKLGASAVVHVCPSVEVS